MSADRIDRDTLIDAALDVGGEADSVLAALVDPTRRQLLDLLAAQGDTTATKLAERLPVSRQAVVEHLAVLDVAGLVSGGQVGREVRDPVRPAGAERDGPVDGLARGRLGPAAGSPRLPNTTR